MTCAAIDGEAESIATCRIALFDRQPWKDNWFRVEVWCLVLSFER
jgi:hypothetical protein